MHVLVQVFLQLLASLPMPVLLVGVLCSTFCF